MISVPARTLVDPEYVLLPDSMSVPGPSLVRLALPEILATVRDPAATVTVELAVQAAEPELISRDPAPRYVKLPPQTGERVVRFTPLDTARAAPGAIERLPVPRAETFPRTSVPWASVVPPEYVFAPESVQVPVPCFKIEVGVVAPLLTMTPEISPVPAVDPCRVRVFVPIPEEVTPPDKTSAPVPDWSITPPPAVPPSQPVPVEYTEKLSMLCLLVEPPHRAANPNFQVDLSAFP